MEPNLWGPDTWKFLHILTLKSQASYDTLTQFFYHLQYLLPCPTCRDNYQKHYQQSYFLKIRNQYHCGWFNFIIK